MKKFIKSSYFALILLLIYLPIAIMVFFSFNSGTSVSNWLGFSTKWYEQFFKDATFMKSIITSLFVAVVSTVVSLIIGVSAAIGLSKLNRRKQVKWLTVANIPLINADIITAVALMVVFLLSGIKFGIGTLIMAHISFNVPYVIITVMPRLRKIDKSIIEASNDLGAKSSTVIFKVILPILKPAIILASVIAFAMSFDDFIISYFTGGDQTNVAGFIYTAKRIKPFIFAFGTLMVAFIAIGVIAWNAVLITKEKQEESKAKLKNGTYRTKQTYRLNDQLAKLKFDIDNMSYIKKSKNLFMWYQYGILKFKFYLASAKNFDKKISKLEWRRYKVQSEINQEKRYASRLKKAQEKFRQLNKQLAKTNDVKKAAKLTIQLEKVEEKIEFLSEEIAWVKERDQEAAKKAKSIDKKLKALNKEFNAEQDPSKATTKWYMKKIKYYQEWKIEVEEGKNNYKLRMIVEQLREVQKVNQSKISDIATRLDLIATQLFRRVSLTSAIVEKIHSNPDDKQLVFTKEKLINSFVETKQKQVNKTKHQIEQIRIKIAKAQEKYFPANIEETNFTKGFFARSWKILLVSLLALASFSGLTVAYIRNNIYDLVIGNWGEYIDRSLLSEFEKEYNVKINYQEYDSNETLYNKLYTFSYDLMVPSDYMVQKLAEEGKLEHLDYSKINVWSNEFIEGTAINAESENKLEMEEELLKVMANSKVKTDQIDIPEHSLKTGTIVDYSLNYLWGDLTIVVNPNAKGFRQGGANIQWLLDEHPEVIKIVGEPNFLTNEKLNYDSSLQYEIVNSQLSWQILWDAAEAGKSVVINEDPKNVFAIAGQKNKGHGNLTTKAEIDQAEAELKQLIYKTNVGLEGDSLIQTAAEGRFDFAVMYNGDAAQANTIYNGEDDGQTGGEDDGQTGGEDDGQTGGEDDGQTGGEDEPALIANPLAPINQADKIYFLYGRPNKNHGNFIETTNIYSDNIVMAKNSTNKDLAYEFINFMIAHAQELSEYTGTPTPYKETMESATAVGGPYEKYKNLFNPIIMKDQQQLEGNLEPFFYNGDIDNYLVDKYTNLIAGKQ